MLTWAVCNADLEAQGADGVLNPSGAMPPHGSAARLMLRLWQRRHA